MMGEHNNKQITTGCGRNEEDGGEDGGGEEVAKEGACRASSLLWNLNANNSDAILVSSQQPARAKKMQRHHLTNVGEGNTRQLVELEMGSDSGGE